MPRKWGENFSSGKEDIDIHLLRLDDDEESPFIVQKVLKGVHLVEPDWDAYYQIARRVLYETKSIRFRRETSEK